MATSQTSLDNAARKNLESHSRNFLKDPNIMGLGVGRKYVNDENTGETCVTVLVARKIPKKHLSESQLIPKKLKIGRRETLTDVIESGPIYALAVNTARERPARPGASIGHINISAGTFGAVVTDTLTGNPVILSNNHVLAASNEATIGDNVLQPGPADEGKDTVDVIGAILRFVPLDFEGGNNAVDAAICHLSELGLVDNRPHDLIPRPSSDHPAVGLLFAGSFTLTIINPIHAVLEALNVAFPEAKAVVAPVIGMHVQKTGRTTGATYNTILNTDATVRVGYGGGRSAIFVNQIITGAMSLGGDSGSLVIRGGGGKKGCGSTSDVTDIKKLSIGTIEIHSDCCPPPNWRCPGKLEDGEYCNKCNPATVYFCLECGADKPPEYPLVRQVPDYQASSFWAKSMQFRDQVLAESSGGRRLTRLYYAAPKAIAYAVEHMFTTQNEAIKQASERLIPFVFATFTEPSDPALEFTAQHVDDLKTLLSSLEKGVEFTNRGRVSANQIIQLGEEFVGKLVADILELLDDKEYVERIPAGSQFMGNRRSKEVHDLDNLTNNCQVDEIITAKHAVFFDTSCLEREQALDLIHAEGYDNCHYCIGESKR